MERLITRRTHAAPGVRRLIVSRPRLFEAHERLRPQYKHDRLPALGPAFMDRLRKHVAVRTIHIVSYVTAS